MFPEEVGEVGLYSKVRKAKLGKEVKDFDLYPDMMGEGNEEI